MKVFDPQGREVSILTNIESTGRVFLSRLPNVATAVTLVSGIAHFVYVGRTTQVNIVKYVEFYVNSAGGTGTQVAEVGLFSSPSAPNKQTQALTRLAAVDSTGTAIDALSSLGLKRASFGVNGSSVAAGTHLWAAIRTAMPTPQPALGGLCMDYNEGLVLKYQSGIGALTTVSSPISASNISLIGVGGYLNTAMAPDLRVTLD